MSEKRKRNCEKISRGGKLNKSHNSKNYIPASRNGGMQTDSPASSEAGTALLAQAETALFLMIDRMQQVMGLFAARLAQKFLVKDLDIRVFVRKTQRLAFVFRV